MAKSTQSMLNLFSVGAGAQEVAINTFGTLDQSIVVGEGDFIQMAPLRETNRGEATGFEEPTEVYDNGRTYTMAFSPKFCTYNKMAFLMAYALGICTTVAAGTGYKHTITPIAGYVDDDRSNPTFTAAQRLSDDTQWTRFASGAVQSVTETYAPGEWVKIAANLVFSGKYEKVITEEEVADLDNVTAITLSTAVPGATPAERLENIRSIRVQYNGIKDQYISPVSVDDQDPAVITIASLGGAGDTVTYKVLYRHPDPAWLPLPAAISEPNIKVSQVVITIGGSWNGTEFQGGRTICSDLGSLEATFTNDSLDPMQTPCAADPDQQYGGVIKRSGRTQTITLSKELRDVLTGAIFDAEDKIGLEIVADGVVFPGDTEKYSYRRVWPVCAIMDNQLGTDNSRNQETLSLEALEDATYGSTIVVIQNIVAAYAA